MAEVRLRPMRDDEVAAHIERSRAEYAEDVERNGGLTRTEALAKAERDLGALFPGGRPAAGQQLRVVEELASGTPIGRVHYAERPPGSRTAWLFDVAIDESRRGQGLGRRAMELFEEEAGASGFVRIELNVWGGNERARSLYRSLGYADLSVQMGKRPRCRT